MLVKVGVWGLWKERGGGETCGWICPCMEFVMPGLRGEKRMKEAITFASEGL